MEKVIVRLKNNKVKKILTDLEELDLIEIEKSHSDTNGKDKKLSDLKNLIHNKMSEEQIDNQLESLRKEWQRDI